MGHRQVEQAALFLACFIQSTRRYGQVVSEGPSRSARLPLARGCRCTAPVQLRTRANLATGGRDFRRRDRHPHWRERSRLQGAVSAQQVGGHSKVGMGPSTGKRTSLR
jgi:hypothetical protein